MLPEFLRDGKLVVFGLAREGAATLRFLLREKAGARIRACDCKPLDGLSPPVQELLRAHPGIELFCGQDHVRAFDDCTAVVKSPGIPPHLPLLESARRRGAVVTSATNIFLAANQGRVIGVTGTKGKSTTASLIAGILKEAGHKAVLAGNIGAPALDALPARPDRGIACVLELSSYQLEDVAGRIDMAVLVNLFPEHLDYHRGFENYRKAKLNILSCIPDEGAVVYNCRFPEFARAMADLRCAALPFGEPPDAIVSKTVVCRGLSIMPVDEIPLLGAHNQLNVLCAARLALHLGIEPRAIRSAVRRFKALPHRLESVGTFRGIQFVDDAISTTPESTLAALEALGPNVGTLILGGTDRGYDFRALARRVLELNIPAVILFPESGQRIWDEIERRHKELAGNFRLPQHRRVTGMPQCIEAAYELTPVGRICLLSTASPSYSVFENFEDKGRQFKDCVIAAA